MDVEARFAIRYPTTKRKSEWRIWPGLRRLQLQAGEAVDDAGDLAGTVQEILQAYVLVR